MRLAAAFALACAASTQAATHAAVQARLDADVARGAPIVAHVVVALCDNAHQGIVPVPAKLGNGQDPRNNLYWGALYGVKTHLARAGGWTRVAADPPSDARILERLVLRTEVDRAGARVPLLLVADAWDGAHIEPATRAFLDMAAGRAPERVRAGELALDAGGGAHLVAYVGHDGLMDFDVPAPHARDGAPPRSAIVLACASRPYFEEKLVAARAHALLLTTGLMAPEAYTLDAALRAWARGAAPADVRASAAAAYHRYQKCGERAALRLFHASD